MTEQEAKILHLETSVDDLLAGNQRLREQRDQLIASLRHLLRAASEHMQVQVGDTPQDRALLGSIREARAALQHHIIAEGACR